MPQSPATYIEHNAHEAVRLLQNLVRLRTVNPPGENYDAITTFLARELAAVGLKARRFFVPVRLAKKYLPAEQQDYPRFNVLGHWNAGAKKTIHFNAHYDVVPAGGSWRHGDAFSGALEGGWIYGRGTADMKGSMASLLLALGALRATGTKPRCNVEVSFTADEETDSALGANWLVRQAGLRADYAIVMEGGEGRSICCGHNGVVWLEVTVHGRAAHGSRPERGINALEKMSALVLALEDYKKWIVRRTFVTPEKKIMRPTLNIGGVFGPAPGGKINTVPALAHFTLDRRVLPMEGHAEAERDLRAFLAAAARKISPARITVKKISENFACYAQPDHPFFAALASSIARVRRLRPAFSVSTGFNDMHFFAQHLKIPTLGYGPIGEREHAKDERVSVCDIATTAKIYADILTTFAG
ncbi:MAG: ArgE/DapE family deacylase [Verrucomicrobiota bacterium]|nr:ArgE/DapE family deacylase [Verrucomicrobiota bacterium]